MAKVQWQKMLGWNEAQLDEFRISGFLYLRQGLYNKAERFFQVLVLLDPHNAYDNQTLGALYLQQGKEEQCLEKLNIALSIEPFHEPSLLNKAKALLLLRKKEEAFVILRPLEKSLDSHIANDASALLLAYS